VGTHRYHHDYLNFVPQFIGGIDGTSPALRVVHEDGSVVEVPERIWVGKELIEQVRAINAELRAAGVELDVRAVKRGELLCIVSGLGELGDDDGS
jgi:hypothetical protein